MKELIIDKEFRDKIPPLTEAEFEQLRENIINDGEVYEPIVVWNGTIIDGHNRWKIIQEHPEIPYKIKEMNFADKYAAAEWMYRKQLGRRNLTDEQKTYMIGKMYEARKQSVGGQVGHKGTNQHFIAESDKMSSLATRKEIKDGTGGIIGKEFGITSRSVRRAAKFADGIDAIRNVSPEAADLILSGNTCVSKTEVAEVKDATKKELKDFASAVISGEIKDRKKPIGYNAEMRKTKKLVDDVVSDLYSSEVKPFTIEMLEGDIETNGQNYIEMLRSTLTDRSTLLVGDNRKRVAAKIDHIIEEIKKIRGLLE